MKNKKLLNVVTTGIIALSLTTQTVSAAIPAAVEFVNEDDSQIEGVSVPLSEIVTKENDEGTNEILSNAFLGYTKDNRLILYGELPSSRSFQLTFNENSEPLEVKNQFQIEISDIEDNDKFTLRLHDQNDEVLFFDIEYDSVFSKIDELNHTESNLSKQSESKDIEETEDADELPSVLEIEDSTDIIENDVEIADDTEHEETNQEEVFEEVPDYTYEIDDSNEETVSMPRSQEVEELLHGQQDVPMTFMQRSLMSTSSSRTHTNGVYTVVSGDSFNAIATSFNLSSAQLREWNGHVTNTSNLQVGTRLAVTRLGVESMLSQADKDRLYKGNQAEFTTTREFIDFIAPMAIEVANQEGVQGLYPSLMIAQAAHESNYGRSGLGAPPNHNLFGIKGNHNGQSVLMWTWEVYNGNRVNVLAGFRKYPSYSASLQDYANLLRNGVSWNRGIYSGTWRSNSRDVWEVLNNGALNAYATDPAYHTAVRNLINNFDLTQYDSGNYYVRTGTFFGETAAVRNINSMRSISPNMVYRHEQSSATPYRNRRVETTNEFVGEAAAQREVARIKADQGWHASYRQTANSTNHVRVQSGFFNTRARAERAVEELRAETGWYATIEAGTDGRYRLRTGFYVGEESAQRAVKHMENLGWFARTVETGGSTPHYVVYTGVFPNPSSVSRAHSYFASRGWQSRETMVDRYTHYYRVYIEGFPSQNQATNFVNQLNSRFGWHSSAFPVN